MKLLQAYSMRAVAALACAIALTGNSAAVSVTYDYVQVGYLFGNGVNSTLTGHEDYVRTSSNLPIALQTGTVDYSFGAAANAGSLASGTWAMGNGIDSLTGNHESELNEQVNVLGTPFVRYTGHRSVTGGEGYFAGATGSGTVESYLYYFNTGNSDTFAYQGIQIARMSVTVETDAPVVQTDTRGVSVLVKNGDENGTTLTGTNFGYYTSASPSLAPMPITNEASYTFSNWFNPLPFVGTFLDVGADGLSTITGDTYGNFLEFNHLGSIFTLATGQATVTGATGIFDGARSVTDYESYAVGTTPPGSPGLQGTYSAIIINRVAPVPEPQTYAMLLAGLGLLGAMVRRRSSR